MNITDIRIRKINATGKMKAIVSVTFDDMFVVHDMKIIEGANGPFIAMPSRKTPSGEYKDIAHPINTETREMIQTAILNEYNKLPEEEGFVATPAEDLEDKVGEEKDATDSSPSLDDSL